MLLGHHIARTACPWHTDLSLLIYTLLFTGAAVLGNSSNSYTSRGTTRFLTRSESRQQLVAVIPVENLEDVSAPPRQLTWLLLQWRKKTTAKNVRLEHVDVNDQQVASILGNFGTEIKLPYGTPELQCRFDESKDRLFCLGRFQDGTPDVGGCCADSMVIYYRDGRPSQTVELISMLQQGLADWGDLSIDEAATAYFSHSFQLEFSQSSLGKQSYIDAYVGLQLSPDLVSGGLNYGICKIRLRQTPSGEIVDGQLVPTASGRGAFLPYRDVGTASDTRSDGVYRIQFDYESRVPSDSILSITGIEQLMDKNGNSLLAWTNLFSTEVVICSDPWYSRSIAILQRFGTPPILSQQTGKVIGNHNFGYNASQDGPNPAVGHGMHNPFHSVYYDTGRGELVDTITVYQNVGDKGSGYKVGNSVVYEFEINLSPEETSAQASPPSDSVFSTRYRRVPLRFGSPNMGGARPLADGLYLVARGANIDDPLYPVGYQVVDANGKVLAQRFIVQPGTPASILAGTYDPFLFIDVPDNVHLEGLESRPPYPAD